MDLSHPIVVIGAPRSGTNLLRDLLCRFPGVGTWPCDEINYIWRHGNARRPTDELGRADARPRVRHRIRAAFARELSRGGWQRIVEKTCANSLRVDFVDAVLPEATFVFIVRDGRDAATSAFDRWTSPPGARYLMRKLRFAPTTDLPYYAWLQVKNRAPGLFGRSRPPAFWGPRFEGLERIASEQGVLAACAAQWARCVTRARAELARLRPERVVTLRYEDLVREPQRQLGALAQALHLDHRGPAAPELVRSVSAASIGRWRRTLDAPAAQALDRQLRDELADLGYV